MLHRLCCCAPPPGDCSDCTEIDCPTVGNQVRASVQNLAMTCVNVPHCQPGAINFCMTDVPICANGVASGLTFERFLTAPVAGFDCRWALCDPAAGLLCNPGGGCACVLAGVFIECVSPLPPPALQFPSYWSLRIHIGFTRSFTGGGVPSCTNRYFQMFLYYSKPQFAQSCPSGVYSFNDFFHGPPPAAFNNPEVFDIDDGPIPCFNPAAAQGPFPDEDIIVNDAGLVEVFEV